MATERQKCCSTALKSSNLWFYFLTGKNKTKLKFPHTLKNHKILLLDIITHSLFIYLFQRLQNRSHIRQATLKQDSLPPLPEEEDLESEETLAQQSLQDNQLQSNPANNGPPNPTAGSQITNG